MEEKLTQVLKSFNYQHNRYNVHYSVAVWRSNIEEIDINILSASIRKTDRVVHLNNGTYAVVFERTDTEAGIIAANNLLEFFESKFNSKPLFTAVVNTSQFENVQGIVPDLVTKLQENSVAPDTVKSG